MKEEAIIKLIELVQEFSIWHVIYLAAVVVILFFGYSGWVKINLEKDKAKMELEYDRKMKEAKYIKSFQKEK